MKCAIQTGLEFNNRYDMETYTQDDISILTRMFVNIDPITHIKEMSIYTDDGRGNGVLIFKCNLECHRATTHSKHRKM